MTAAAGPPDAPAAPGVARRLASFVYEGVLLFGIVMGVGLVYGVLTGQRHALEGSLGLQATLFAAIGVYFVYFWCRHGQTLAMRTWRIRLVDRSGAPPTVQRACARYLLAWLWFVPALAAVKAAGLRGGWPIALTLLAGVLAYAALAWLRRDRQFWHDAVCGTRLVSWHRPPRQR